MKRPAHPHITLARGLALGLCGVIAGCGQSTAPSQVVADGGVGQDTGLGVLADVAGSDVAADGASDVAAADSGAVGCPGAAGCSCADNSDCDQSVCLETSTGATCAASCTTSSSCAAGEACTPVAGSGGDGGSVCAQIAAHLCDPCKTNAACGGPGAAGATCVVRGVAGNFCGVACGSGAAACPSGTVCVDAKDVAGGTSKQCVPANDAACTCSPRAMEKQLATPCGGAAACSGVRACLAAGADGAPAGGGLSVCSAGKPAPETCNGLDDDCDGDTDEAAPCDDKDACTTDACTAGTCVHNKTTGSCDDGDPCTAGDSCAAGTCAGTVKDCDDSNACTTDSCDKQNGCSHAPTNEAGACDDGDVCTASDTCTAGACTGKSKTCDDGNTCTTDTCDAVTGKCGATPAVGSCDDGDPCTVDSCAKATGCVSVVDGKQTQPCYSANPATKGVGLCTAGVQTCQIGGGFGPCVGEIGPASKELCNGKDDTCNGKVDDACVGGGPPQLAWRFGSVVVHGTNKGLSARMFVGGSSVAGKLTSSSKLSMDLGFYAWISAWLK